MTHSTYPEGLKCLQCRENKIFIDRSISALCFNEKLKKAIYAFKYHGKDHYGYFLSSFMSSKIRKEKRRKWLENVLIVPVPLSREKLKDRGYNQSEILSSHISKKLFLSKPISVIERHFSSKSQTALKRNERQKNIKGAFFVNKKIDIKKASILLVDDVLTTGATMNECARILKQNGAREVIGLTLASVPV
ncbi:MAG: ComF family protein [Candidatus Aureabacteria bacterium]|nr:ComF family protein [Candidatus Auribacterota bacterium]